ncbi:erythromycin esterase family protein [Zhouia amylolytica]|uniref:Erythromycin esterase n=1 Tax=Zhouia amylolytica AD3 TaxID=1286632 RepID=W2UKW5_9FLAO|nr:erythromycin esterase family protein [Zhouia amylolytica]ETN94648.1 hypothetical protein P278_25910 [Zhouia amylolytica AD3]
MTAIFKNAFLFLLILFYKLDAQAQNPELEKHNLDFEILDKGAVKGWEDFGRGLYKIGIDSIVTQKGKYATTIEFDKDSTGFRAWSYAIPARYNGSKIKLTGYIKTQNVTEGWAGLWMRVDPKVGFNNMKKQGVTGTTDWEKYEIEFNYNPLKAEKIFVGGLLVGKGKMWIDNLEVTIDGKKLENLKFFDKPQLTKEVQEDLYKRIKKNRERVDLTSVKKLNKSLESLIELVGDKKIVAIGEDTHGTSEYYKLREAITKKLIMEKGFNVVILENPYDDIEILTDEIHNKNLDSLMRKHLFSIYQTQEMKSFLAWYKEEGFRYNVEFKGCDDSFWVLNEILTDELLKLNNPQLIEMYHDFSEKVTLSIEEYLDKYPEKRKLPKNNYELNKEAYNDILAIEEYLIEQKLYSERLKELLLNAKTTYINYKNVIDEIPIQSRDEMMAERIKFLGTKPDTKIIVWAHNAHISNSVIIDNEIGIMGRNLKQFFKDDYHSIGMSSLNGTYSFIEEKFINGDHKFNDRLIKGYLSNQPKITWETIFGDQVNDAYCFQTNNINMHEDIRGVLKLVGYRKESEKDYYQLSPFKMFDTIIFIRTTEATTPLFPDNF